MRNQNRLNYYRYHLFCRSRSRFYKIIITYPRELIFAYWFSFRIFFNLCTSFSFSFKFALFVVRLKKNRILITFIIVAGSTSVRIVGFYIYAKSIEFVINFTFFRSGDRYEISDDSRFNDAIEDRKEYGITSFILQFPLLSPFFSLL